ncbi:MAG: hypothetical protein J0I09_14595 [Sphingobacteriia bacterium]|nr:hypothetical protein [Sphingobacteriia bacterium]
MKKIIATTVIILSFISVTSFAQDTEEATSTLLRTPHWTSNKGYWVIKSTLSAPTEQTVLFYNNNHILVFEQTVSGKILNINKRRVKKQLEKTLDASVIAWENKRDSMQSNLVYTK